MAERTSIVLGTEDWPPFSYEEGATAQVTGLSTEIINATFSRMGVSIKENKVYPWIRAQKAVYAGKVDGVYTASVNDERLKHTFFPSEPIITSKWVLFIHKSNKGTLKFDKLSDLNGKRIGLIKGYNYPAQFKDHVTKNSVIDEVSLETVNISKLLFKRYDYMPAVLETTLHLAKNRPEFQKINAVNKLHYFEKPLATTDFYLIFSKKTVKKEFVDKFSRALIAFKKTNEYQQILKKYLGSNDVD
ncbi:substrate-binding periplasmic protein [Candidatus Terasakiella magnetica]|uniref:substrate-binding periplasmic protein n=1 Tax=Candidatus Terasakiella magnetica TaxID=1867952 RepID=UPI0013F4E1BC|nr:ABC transporter substrate-binding protein [Candidatus Terasakiella magnetica]